MQVIYGGTGWTDEREYVFYPEIRAIFYKLGFHEKKMEYDIDCAGPTMGLGFSNLYIHPMEITGVLDEDLTEKVCNELKKGSSFIYKDIFIGEELKPWTEDDEIKYYESIKDDIKDSIRAAFSGERCFHPIYMLDKITEIYTVRTVYRSYASSSLDPVFRQVKECFKELVNLGEIEGDDKKGFIYVGK